MKFKSQLARTDRWLYLASLLGEGNFVLVVSEGSFGRVATSFFDLFRIENGKIAEHWDTVEAVPERSAWKNDNGKFGF